MFDLIFNLLIVYLVVGVGVSIYAKVVAKTNIAAMFVVALFWPLFLITGFQSGVLGGNSQKRLR
jgi:hypothetical protein